MSQEQEFSLGDYLENILIENNLNADKFRDIFIEDGKIDVYACLWATAGEVDKERLTETFKLLGFCRPCIEDEKEDNTLCFAGDYNVVIEKVRKKVRKDKIENLLGSI